MSIRLGPEAAFQVEVLYYLRSKGRGLLIRAGAEGNKRTWAEASRDKLLGVLPGWPDLMIFKAAGPYLGLALELKSNSGRLQESQKEKLLQLSEVGWKTAVIRPKDDWKGVIDAYFEKTEP